MKSDINISNKVIYGEYGDVWTTNIDVARIFEKHGLTMGRMVALSKSLYVRTYRNHIVYFNGNVFDGITGMKLWWGDLDITLDWRKLLEVAKELKRPLIATVESYRWWGEKLVITEFTIKKIEDIGVLVVNGDKGLLVRGFRGITVVLPRVYSRPIRKAKQILRQFVFKEQA